MLQGCESPHVAYLTNESEEFPSSPMQSANLLVLSTGLSILYIRWQNGLILYRRTSGEFSEFLRVRGKGSTSGASKMMQNML